MSSTNAINEHIEDEGCKWKIITKNKKLSACTPQKKIVLEAVIIANKNKKRGGKLKSEFSWESFV